ncbi:MULTISPECIES: hypothetical protein [unclassified Pseudoflavonifractor]|uniref:hypothetical protein n=1 Tax=unclassified Pseudoflavonifractor TaxID=2628103 RepID=UPI000B39C0B9|nr:MULTISPECIES: hypothetical protein [unclassified Pseudoflavonifractor]NJE73922.1 hypothetical protein [Pseudoflavonifractor sp. SW1122]OUP40556.1 hypothetical protein B5F22_11140 [Pseudoflavonifractor sp. An187]
MNQELFHEMQRFYDRLETRSGQLFHALFHRVFELEVGWYGGHYHKNEDGTWIREAYPIPVIGVKGFCDIEVQPDHISVSTKLRRSTALNYSFNKFAEYDFEAYGVEDYLADFYHPGQTIEELKENLLACNEPELGFSFTLPFDVDGAEILELVQLLRREGFYY